MSIVVDTRLDRSEPTVANNHEIAPNFFQTLGYLLFFIAVIGTIFACLFDQSVEGLHADTERIFNLNKAFQKLEMILACGIAYSVSLLSMILGEIEAKSLVKTVKYQNPNA